MFPAASLRATCLIIQLVFVASSFHGLRWPSLMYEAGNRFAIQILEAMGRNRSGAFSPALRRCAHFPMASLVSVFGELDMVRLKRSNGSPGPVINGRAYTIHIGGKQFPVAVERVKVSTLKIDLKNPRLHSELGLK